ncbi:dipeptide/oligopeptide/nickel ABC transporter ATP-binding protein [Alkalihalobacillus sp. LMS39]|uniref:ABC transporter ATP-binding protein n=1 Tax=Alkalihalobacillus sp. LMS39 TaxID=2924032 RepID=UPI001FB37C4F|nr:dipeptide/oligopeptide/nickel ABC transporter ATP-binding protein [Alkalihalobacillus sp. LMS39]UOE94842.1 dipeptide/oligopeptide/nickel ABC transporter ATP-binding protein [Alkalihalobacillus sp. LMS39]
MTLLQIKNVSKVYPVRKRKIRGVKQQNYIDVLKNINMTVERGESVGIVGESGSGKSTLAKVIMNMERAKVGNVFLHNREVSLMKDLEIYKSMQLVLQDQSQSLFPKRKVEDILREPLQNYFPSKTSTWHNERIKTLLELVNLEPSYLQRFPGQLSGGQKQRVCIAKALAVEPELIIFDESIASLDQQSQQEITQMLQEIQQREKCSYLFITHDLDSARQLCDRIVVMYKGEIVEMFKKGEEHKMTHPYARLLFQVEDTESVFDELVNGL